MKKMIGKILGEERCAGRLVRDTSDFMHIERGDILALGRRTLLILGNEVESGFGMDGEPKFWVKSAVDLETEQRLIVKLVYFERYRSRIGNEEIEFFRSPHKESEVLRIVRGHPHFMQGAALRDARQNEIRIIERIRGEPLSRIITRLSSCYENYFYRHLPLLLQDLLPCFKALSFLHENHQIHGDIRCNHIFYDADRCCYRWIDFDYTCYFPENPRGFDFYGMGNVLAEVIGGGPILYFDVRHGREFRALNPVLSEADFSVVNKNLLMNLKKVYPFIPDSLNDILIHFSASSGVYYDTIHELTNDLEAALSAWPGFVENLTT